MLRAATCSIWRRLRPGIGSAIVLAAGAIVLAWLVSATATHLAARGVSTGFDFLGQPARLSISESWIPFASGQDTYARALLIGALNTASVSVLVIAFATVLGMAMGLARLARNWLLSRSMGLWIELIRNVPVPLHLLFWYQLLLQLPPTRQALRWGDFMALSNRGLWIPGLAWRDGALVIDRPVLHGFNFEGGVLLSPELAALVVALTLYSSAFVAEIVRAGVLSVPKGQWHAAESLGMRRLQVLQFVVMPLSLRLILPSLTGEYLNTIKNSSLAVIIGYPELTSLINTTLSETGRPLEAIALLMLAYLTISLPVSAGMNLYASRTVRMLR